MPTPPDLDDVRRRLGADPATTALLFDFDGTLAPIVDDPAAATAVDGAVELLERLATRFARVAVISGRPRAFLVGRVGPAVDLSGLYGLETRVDGRLHDHPDAARWRQVVTDVVDPDGTWAEQFPAGVLVEAKGLSITVHYRQAPDAAGAVAAWTERVARDTGLDARAAKMSIELHPPLATDKGSAVEALTQGCRTVAYLGDDLGDLPAFDALDRLAAAGVATVKIAVASTDLPDAVADASDVVLDGPDAVVTLLGPLAG